MDPVGDLLQVPGLLVDDHALQLDLLSLLPGQEALAHLGRHVDDRVGKEGT